MRRNIRRISMINILIVEDDEQISNLIRISLTKEGYHCTCALDGEKGANLIEVNSYDLILLDVMLPKVDGYELMVYVQEFKIPVIFITAKGTIQDKAKGFGLGADDYLVKPFEIEELQMRVANVLRHYGKGKQQIEVLNAKIDVKKRQVQQGDVVIDLTPKEYELLLVLVRNKNIALHRYALYEKVWEEEFDEESRTLDIHIRRLRKKLGWEQEIKTVFRTGYMLEVPL